MSEVWQLHARGPIQGLEGNRRMVSRRIFAKRHWAEAYIDEFREICSRRDDFTALDPAGIVIDVVRLELVEYE